jgi:hypothetical protein
VKSSSRTDDFFIKDDLLMTNGEERKLLDKSWWRRRNNPKSKSAPKVIYDNIVESENSLNETLPVFKDLLAAHLKLSEAACSFLVPFFRFPFLSSCWFDHRFWKIVAPWLFDSMYIFLPE